MLSVLERKRMLPAMITLLVITPGILAGPVAVVNSDKVQARDGAAMTYYQLPSGCKFCEPRSDSLLNISTCFCVLESPCCKLSQSRPLPF